MYAIIASGGKQYKVTEGELIKVESLNKEAGSEVQFDQVLMIQNDDSTNVGTPYLANAKVIGEIASNGRGEKISIIKFRRRKHYMKRMGHRQNFTEVKITKIVS
jgi:large subunit ribosomal protein L21